MKNKVLKRMAAFGLVAALTVSALTGCGPKAEEDPASGGNTEKEPAKDANFSWWIYQIDGYGTHYQNYEESPVAQYVNAQYWDSENGGIGTEETGRKLNFSYVVPVAGSESENFNTMIGTESYTDLIDMSVSGESAKSLYEAGILMDITEYVEKYMPNYLKYLDEHPELKPFVQVKEDDGSIHYYGLYNFIDGVKDPWEGRIYRRDWIVKYAEPTEYVWDWDDEYVKENGHPEVTPLARAQEEKNLSGWKKNEVTKFEANYGEDPNEDYTDNVIFPSGKEDPITISDWEWMFETFAKVIKERGWEGNSSSYCTTIYYKGVFEAGDLNSSFGGGTGAYYVKDGKVSFDGTSDNFKAYVECMNNWYEKGWLDDQFNTRSAEPFFAVNSAGVNQGMVGMWVGMPDSLGTMIRPTCQNDEDKRDAYAMAAALPINDVYGGEEQMYKNPDALYQEGRVQRGIGITNKAKDKDLATLFTFFDWAYTQDGSETIYLGLTEEKLASQEFDPDIYGNLGYKNAFTTSTNEDGQLVYKKSADPTAGDDSALSGRRMAVGIEMANTDERLVVSTDFSNILRSGREWSKYVDTGSVLNYANLLTTEESEKYAKVKQTVGDVQAQKLPDLIKGGMDHWQEYVDAVEACDPNSVVQYLQKYVDLANDTK